MLTFGVMSLFMTAGGVALMLFAIRFLRKGLDRLFGTQLEVWVRSMAASPVRAFFTGIGIAAIAPSSTTVAVLSVQSVQDRQLSARQMFAVMLGADIGLTLMVILIAFRLDGYAPILLLVGVVLFMFTSGRRSRGTGQVILAMGFIFLGIGIIRGAAGGNEPSPHFAELVEAAGHYPAVLAGIAALLALAMQSSTATIGLVIGLGLAGAVDLNIAIATVAGANVGIGTNALIVGWREVESRRLGLANVLSKLVVAAGVIALLPWLLSWVEQLPAAIDKQTAATHLGFNVVRAMIFLPVVGIVAAAMERLVPDQPTDTPRRFGPRYLKDAPRDSATLALGMSQREVLRTSEIVRRMLSDVWQALKTNDAELARDVQSRDDQVDTLDAEIKKFLVGLTANEGGDRAETDETMRQLRFLNELENIGDIIDKSIADVVIKRVDRQVRFSDEAWADINRMFEMVRENVLIAENAFNSRDADLARQLLRHKEHISTQERTLRDNHFKRLSSGHGDTYDCSAMLLELLTHLKRINSCVTHVAYTILDGSQGR